MSVLILDNYDSFTYNLYQEVGVLGATPEVVRNDAMTIEQIKARSYDAIIIGPGPGNPYTARDIGVSRALIDYAMASGIPLLGVCLGHQILGVHFGATVVRAKEPFHGKASILTIEPKSSALFKGLPESIEVMRYHSLCVEDLRPPLRATLSTNDGVVMALEHESLPIYGVQFHPESIGTPQGRMILKNFLGTQKE